MKHSIMPGLIILAGLMAMAMGGDEPGKAEKTVAGEPNPPTIMRFYDIRDLLVNIPDFEAPVLTYAGDKSQGTINAGAAPVERSSRTNQEAIEILCKIITDTVDPGSWRDGGGSVGSIRESEGVLIISQTAENQKRLEEFLTQYRRMVRPEPVRIRAHWIVARRGDFAANLKPVEDFAPAATQPAARNARDAVPHPSAIMEIDEAVLNALPGVTHYRGEIVAMRGQRAYVMASGQRWEAAAGTNPPADSTSAMNGGLILDASIHLGGDRQSILLTLRNQWNNATTQTIPAPATQPAPLPTTAPSATADLPANQGGNAFHDIETTARLPLGKLVLIGGITLDATSPPSAAAQQQKRGDEPVQLYLFVEASGQ